MLAALDEKNISYEAIDYIEKGISKEEIFALSRALNLSVSKFVRSKEPVFSELVVNWDQDDEAANAIADNPILLERPIVIERDKALIARSSEAIEEVLKMK